MARPGTALSLSLLGPQRHKDSTNHGSGSPLVLGLHSKRILPWALNQNIGFLRIPVCMWSVGHVKTAPNVMNPKMSKYTLLSDHSPHSRVAIQIAGPVTLKVQSTDHCKGSIGFIYHIYIYRKQNYDLVYIGLVFQCLAPYVFSLSRPVSCTLHLWTRFQNSADVGFQAIGVASGLSAHLRNRMSFGGPNELQNGSHLHYPSISSQYVKWTISTF